MMKTIIVPIDFSIYSENAFLSAMKIAPKADADIICINVVSTSMEWHRLSNEEKAKHSHILAEEAEAKEMLENFVLNHKIKDTRVEAVVSVGVPAREIINLVNKKNADLIVIGAYGRGREEGRFIGSNIQKVLRLATCPVLAVKKPIKGTDLKKIAFASLFNEASKPAFLRMKPLIEIFESTVYFLYVNTPTGFLNTDKTENRMKDFAIGLDDLVIHPVVYNFDEVENGIINFAESNNIGWIGVVSNNRKSSKSYQMGVTETVLFKTDIPVLSVKTD